jgi:hypothetical protein
VKVDDGYWCCCCCYYYYYGSTALSWALAAFWVSRFYTQSLGLRRREISPSQGLSYTQNKRTQYRHLCLEWDSNPWSLRSSERRQFIPQTARPLWSA